MLVFGIGAFSTNRSILSEDSERENVDYTDLYEKEIEIGNTKLRLEVKTATFIGEDGHHWLNGEYRFYSTDKKPKLLATVASLIPPEYNEEHDEDRFFSMKDITGDDVPEILVLVLKSGSNLREWEVLQLEDDSLENIIIKGNKDNPNWVEFDDIGMQKGRVWTLWHGSDMRGANLYALEGNELVLEKTARYTFKNGSDDCDVSIKNAGDAEYTFIKRVSCSDEGKYPTSLIHYFLRDPQSFQLMSELYDALSDPKLALFARTFLDQCDTVIASPTYYSNRNVSLAEMLRRLNEYEPMKITPDGSKVLIMPCIEGAYQTADMPILYDGVSYTPLSMKQIVDTDGEQVDSYTATGFGYNPQTDIFSYHWAGNGAHSCWGDGEYKLVGRELVLQKFIADWDCADVKGRDYEGEVVYDINKQ